jgi:hypothetical protein
VGLFKPKIVFKNVVFPEPFAQIIEIISHFFTSKLRFETSFLPAISRDKLFILSKKFLFIYIF